VRAFKGKHGATMSTVASSPSGGASSVTQQPRGTRRTDLIMTTHATNSVGAIARSGAQSVTRPFGDRAIRT
jgi:hypothetical protein